MSRMRRSLVVPGVLAGTLLIPSAADAAPDVPDANLAQAVLSIGADQAVLDIAIAQSVVPLETEESDGADVTLRISSDVLFEFNSATLTEAARKRIAGLAPRLRDAQGTVQVSGHSDSIGAPGYNLRLSEQRARAVKAALEAALGGTSVKIEAKGYGETRPVAPNETGGKDDPAGRAKNRRVDIAFQKG